MDVLVPIKRVPALGSEIRLTADGTAVDTRHLGFTIGPHEECAVEEAVRIAAATGGSAGVLTVGPPEADEQLRYAMSMGGRSRCARSRRAPRRWWGSRTPVTWSSGRSPRNPTPWGRSRGWCRTSSARPGSGSGRRRWWSPAGAGWAAPRATRCSRSWPGCSAGLCKRT